MAPVVDSGLKENEAFWKPRRKYLLQRITRNMDSTKSVRDSQVGSRHIDIILDLDDDDDHHGDEDRDSDDDDNHDSDDDDDDDDDDDNNYTTVSTTSSVALTSTSLPTVTLESTPTSTLSLLTQSTVSVPIAANPQVSVSVMPCTSTSITSPMVTQTVETIWIVSASAQPRQASGGSYTSEPVASIWSTCIESGAQTTLFAFENAPTPMVSADGVDNDFPDDMGYGDDHRGDPGGAPGPLSPDAEHALISVGSIGGFIIVCFVFWMAWRMVKKSKRKADGIYGNRFLPPNPRSYFGRGQRGWQGLDDAPNEMLGSPPRYEKATSPGQASEVYMTNDPRSQAQYVTKQGPSALPQLQTNLSSSSNFSPYSTPTSVNMHNAQTSQTNRQPAAPPHLQTSFSPANNVSPFTNTLTSSGNAASSYVTISPISTALPGGTMGTMQTAHSNMADPSYSQSELSRQPYDPSRRHVYRASELSSLSSGFGDGDIIMPPPAALQGDPSGVSHFNYQQVPNVGRKDSIANASEAGGSYRDTVYTTTSEDMPTRYRTVKSWVSQQTGRIQRAARRAEEDAPPPVPTMPPEERYTMMMDDEEPRRPDMPKGTADTSSPYAENKEMNP